MTQINTLAGLYAITDEHLIPDDSFIQQVELALAGGARIIQYRNKTSDNKTRYQQATGLLNLCKRYQARLIINDDIDLCQSIGADGVHLGRDDNTIAAAREQLGENVIIGASCYNDLEFARQAQANDANYVAFGSTWPSSTKPDAIVSGLELLKQAHKKLAVPVCAIGGISIDNASTTVATGIDMIAVISSLFGASDIKEAARQLSKFF